ESRGAGYRGRRGVWAIVTHSRPGACRILPADRMRRDVPAHPGGEAMFATARALFEHIVDYAGLFPPAKLPLPEALRRYAADVSGPRQWFVGRFVCPATRLEELTREARALGLDAGLRVA